jgi:transcriptional regulator with XRE-family HTH domain
MQSSAPVGELLRGWRQRRRLSQLGLACEAEISTRHLSFVETGRAAPSREMVLRLAEHLEVPARDRNMLLVAAGYAPMFPARPMDDPALGSARAAIDFILAQQLPLPAFALDRHWNVVASNRALPELYVGVADVLLAPPVNAPRLTLHPQGLAPRIQNLPEWRSHLLDRLRRQVELTADPALADLLAEVRGYALPPGMRPDHRPVDPHTVLVPLRIATSAGVLSFFTMTMVFGTAIDVTLSELTLELLFAADANTDAYVRRVRDAQQAVAAE